MLNYLKVLVVDDQPGVRYLLNIIIEEEGHKVYTAQNGKEAVDMISLVHPELVLMDVRMPVMGGLEALKIIKKISPDTEVVMMTAYGAEDTVEAAMQNGALTCIAKPFDIEEIKNFLKQYVWNISRDALKNGYRCG
ncbi:response regulator receiver protein [Desulfofarcimen acetoxidans DSM 771]|jgi:two-component system response regulator (stage 0 sporulation protein F)|uniref:Stage 0 sporulation protein A homolog n=1 Tax=Desulfofarcimen acetoxidans (strain ATCC 49208 / DSM 771 / KCTC 5769 / VKM B-1644 / 5575) TaxID=485916 RepID=C8VWT4_DESAS|nr:response regulator [Desulfofarcimen acetoxidans]ACV64448.1 response regulator receiver protein [Desulfofarcimen acetoxidans DSM 771]